MSRKSKAAEFEDVSYNIDVMGQNVLVTEAMKDYATEKVSKIERIGQRIIDISIVLEVQKHEHRCDIVLKMGHVKVKSHAATDNMYASIDKAVDKMEAQLRKYKSRIQDHQAKPIEMIEMNVNIYEAKENEISLVNEDIEAENHRRSLEKYSPHQIVKNKKLKLKFLTIEEAIMKMELSGDNFLVFKSEVDRKIKVLYRRKDDHFAIIEPES